MDLEERKIAHLMVVLSTACADFVDCIWQGLSPQLNRSYTPDPKSITPHLMSCAVVWKYERLFLNSAGYREPVVPVKDIVTSR